MSFRCLDVLVGFGKRVNKSIPDRWMGVQFQVHYDPTGRHKIGSDFLLQLFQEVEKTKKTSCNATEGNTRVPQNSGSGYCFDFAKT